MRQAIQKQLMSLSLKQRIDFNVFITKEFGNNIHPSKKFRGFPVDMLMEESSKSLAGGK